MQAIGQSVQQVQTAEQTEFTPEQEYYIGRAVAANLLSTRKVYDNPAATQYLNTLESALVALAPTGPRPSAATTSSSSTPTRSTRLPLPAGSSW